MALSPQWLDELRSRTLLSALIGKSVKITRAGREWKACCPFHNEKTPSFTINDEKGFYHCFGCGAHGDAIRWMTDQRGLPFMDAVKELAGLAGLDVPAADPRAAQRAEQALTLRDVVEASAAWFRDRLADDEGAPVRDYLAQRGLDRATAEAFGLGFAPDARGRLRDVLSTYGEPLAVEAGMLIDPPADTAGTTGRDGLPSGKAQQKREPYDRFRGRLMIPIRDARGRTIAFGGRILGPGEPKYLNSPDTPLFDKGRVLYNLDRAAPAARTANRLIVVEGYMDVIALAQAGIGEAVAPLGTALTEEQLILCWRQIPVPTLAFDGDAAGQRAAMRAAERALPMLKAGYSLSILTLPTGKDPDDVVRADGAAGFDALMGQASPLVGFLWQRALAARRDDTPESRAAVKAQLMTWCDTITDRDVAALYRRDFLSRFGDAFFPAREQRSQSSGTWQRGSARKPLASIRPPVAGPPVDDVLTRAVISGLLRYPQLIVARIDQLAQLNIADHQDARLLDAMIDAASFNPGVDSAGLLTILAPVDGYNRAAELMRADRVHFSFTRSIASDAGKAATLAPQGVEQLDELLSALAAWPEVERAMQTADQRARANVDEETMAEQARCRDAGAALQQRLRNFAEQASAE